MKSSALEFRFRYLIHTAIFALGFFAPWNHWLHLDPAGLSVTLWGDLLPNLMRFVRNPATASNLILVAAILCAATGAWLRTWGSAYLGSAVVQDGGMHTAATASTGIVADGPYRRVRNPLYLGTFLHTLALSLLMPRSGAIFTIILIGLFQIRLILGEEAYLTRQLDVSYQAYCKLVPRLFLSLVPKIAAAGQRPRWLQGFAGEIYMWGVALSFAIFGWSYNAWLLIQCVLVSFGVSIVLRAFQPALTPNAQEGSA